MLFRSQSISVNTSYNPQFYDEEKIPMSEMIRHVIMCYKYGIKTLYYFNTYDGQGELDVAKTLVELGTTAESQAQCESCVI